MAGSTSTVSAQLTMARTNQKGTMSAVSGRMRQIMALRSDSGRPETAARVCTGVPIAPHATGEVLASRLRAAAWNGLKPRPIMKAPAIATGAPNPAAPSMNAPKQKATSSTWSRRSGVIPATDSFMISNCPAGRKPGSRPWLQMSVLLPPRCPRRRGSSRGQWQVAVPDVVHHEPASVLLCPAHDVLARVHGWHARWQLGAGGVGPVPPPCLDGHRSTGHDGHGMEGQGGARVDRIDGREERPDGILAAHRCHVGRHDHRVRGVELGDRIGVAAARESGPLGIGGVDRLLGAGRGVRWGGRLTAECGGEEGGGALDESHDGAPLGEGEDDTGPARLPQAPRLEGARRASLSCWFDSPWNDSV